VNTFNLRHRLAALLAAAVLAAFAAGCGPGVGGTGGGGGTGAEPPGVLGLAYFGAQPADACTSTIGTLIGCASTTVGGDPVQAAPRTLGGDCATAGFDDDDLVLDVLCGGATFSGSWGLGPDGQARYFGLWGPDLLQPPTEPATVEVAVQADSLVLWLRGSDGRLIAGPLTVRTR
jgi:hypothetical protein